MCYLMKDMVVGVFNLADQDGDEKVTREEMNGMLDFCESIDFSMMLETMWNEADEEKNGELAYD